MNQSTGTITTYFTPYDATDALAAIVALMDSATTTIRLVMYGFTHPTLVDALCRAHTRGVDVKAILDHTQSCGPSEVKALHSLLSVIPAANVRIGTSPVAHQIVHLKGLCVDGQTIKDGSLNWSPSAFQQINDVNITQSPARAQAFSALFDELWTWIDQNESNLQQPAA